jgi:hypothetical protein
VPCDVSLLERGAVCLALYPYTTGFPLERVLREVEGDVLARLERHESIDSIVATIAPEGQPPEVVVTMKLRRVLLLQEGTERSRHDVLVARVDSLTEQKRAKENWYKKLASGIHPAHYLIGARQEHGTGGKEAYVDALNVSPIRKAAILRRTGKLEEDEMRAVSERLMRTLELDLSGYIEDAARRL